jgi:tellurite resistance protein
MHKEARINLVARVARWATWQPQATDATKPVSILSLAAAAYGSRPSEDSTVPTGFDPLAVVLFEAIVEGAYIVANADGVFDDDEKLTFERVVVAACGGTVAPAQISGLISDLADQLREDGIDRRIETIAGTVTKREHALEVLRVAALLAQTSEDVSEVERETLEKLATHCGLTSEDVDAAFDHVKEALAEATS